MAERCSQKLNLLILELRSRFSDWENIIELQTKH